VANVLVVEDDDGVRRLLCRALKAEGYAVLEATNAEDGLEVAARECPDLVITDLNLPGMGGDILIRMLRKLPDRPLVVAMSGVRAALALVVKEADGTLSKPIDLDELDSVLGEVLGRGGGR
jgi:two-component system, OmpR family, KDP operon response regulator KdpE